MMDHDGDSRSPGAVARTSSLGVSRVRPRQDRHRRTDESQRAERHATGTDLEPACFDSHPGDGRPHEYWKVVAVVLFVLVTLTLVGETVAQVAGGIDIPAFAVAADLAVFHRIDAARSTAATQARYVAVAAGGLAVAAAGTAGLVAAVRSRS